MRSPTLSYLMATRNKLTFLKHALPRLLSSLREDEEVVVIDGASTDGATEYLRDLYAQGKIHQFLSEPDKGEAHATNKGLLMARGEMVKVISDDDIYHFPTIQLCKEYMLNNPEVDILGSEVGFTYCGMTEPAGVTRMVQDFDNWALEGRPFMFSGLSMMLRRRSLPLLGLLHPGIMPVDEEYSRRATSLPVCVAWCPRLSVMAFRNPASNTFVYHQRFLEEQRLVMRFYNCEPPPPPLWRRLTRPVRWALRPIKRMIVGTPSCVPPLAPPTDQVVGEAFECHSAWLDKHNESLPCSIRKATRGPRRGP